MQFAIARRSAFGGGAVVLNPMFTFVYDGMLFGYSSVSPLTNTYAIRQNISGSGLHVVARS